MNDDLELTQQSMKDRSY